MTGALAAAAPLAAVLALMIARHWSAAAAGGAGLLLALALALGWFNLGGGAAGPGPALALTGAFLEALHSTATILWIVFPALALYELQVRTGAMDRIRQALLAVSDDRRILAILIAWFFGLFMEGAAGFGTPVALGAPLLVGIGYPPVRAVALALVGHAAGVSFGAVGTPVLVQVEMTGLPPVGLATATALLHGLAGWILLVALLRLAGGPRMGWRDGALALLAALCFLVPFLALAWLTGPELPTLGGAFLGTALFLAVLRRLRPQPASGMVGIAGDLAPYAIILGLVLASRLLPGAPELLRSASIGWSLQEAFQGSFQPLYHPDSMLLLGLLAGAVLTGRAGALPAAMRAAAIWLGPVVLALAAMLALSRVMVHAGMIRVLAEQAAATGAAWPLLAPAVGVLGTFVTGSATASNILFTEFQLGTAEALALPVLPMVAAQGFGAAVGNIVCPHNIIAGGATVGLRKQEGEVLASTAAACAAYALAGGLLTAILLRLAG
ncbi:L-lactate permease [Geminicoccus roseus]|uniref:L-lactate permease n=1 Tax=Geminicoccus roseus TaxID=404900 RepID=UPI00040F33C2|nr:L-lactate permease [Geminicoccus roseus]